MNKNNNPIEWTHHNSNSNNKTRTWFVILDCSTHTIRANEHAVIGDRLSFLDKDDKIVADFSLIQVNGFYDLKHGKQIEHAMDDGKIRDEEGTVIAQAFYKPNNYKNN